KDFAAVVEMQWFVTEQVEEEKSARDIIAKLERAGSDASALLEIDRELGARAPGDDERLFEDAGLADRPPPQLHLADDVLLRHGPPVATVGTVVPMVAHHEVVALRNHLRAPVVVPPILRGHVGILEFDVVDEHASV